MPSRCRANAQRIIKDSESEWEKGAKGTAQKKLFRDCFTETDEAAAPVVAKQGQRVRVVSWADLPEQSLPEGVGIDDIDHLLGGYLDAAGKKQTEFEPDPKLKDFENIPLEEGIVSYFLREVQSCVPDAWIDCKSSGELDGGIGKVGYEINFNREFFEYQPPRLLAEIDAELRTVESLILGMLREVTE